MQEFPCVGVVPICAPRPHWVDRDAGYPGQGLAKSSICRSHPAWVCINGTVEFSAFEPLDTVVNANIEMEMYVPVHLNNETLKLILHMLLLNV